MRKASGAFFNTEPVLAVDPELLQSIKQQAAVAARGRFRLCLHHSTADPVQEMIIAHTRASYTQPHRQQASKLYVMIEGELLIVVFDDAGGVARRTTLKPGSRELPCCLWIEPGRWHTTLAQTDVAVVCEVLGNANPDGQATEYAAWAPPESDQASVADFLLGLEAPSGPN